MLTFDKEAQLTYRLSIYRVGCIYDGMSLGVRIFWDFVTSHMHISKLPSRDQVTNIHSYLISLYLLFFFLLFSTRSDRYM